MQDVRMKEKWANIHEGLAESISWLYKLKILYKVGCKYDQIFICCNFSGLIQWMKEVKHQIDKHDRLSLQIVSDNIAKIVEKENDMNLSKYIRSLNENLSKAYTRSMKDEGDSKLSPLLEQMDVVGLILSRF